MIYLSFFVTVQQVCEFTALNVRKSSDYRHKSICAANFAWIYARNYEGTEQTNKGIKDDVVAEYALDESE